MNGYLLVRRHPYGGFVALQGEDNQPIPKVDPNVEQPVYRSLAELWSELGPVTDSDVIFYEDCFDYEEVI